MGLRERNGKIHYRFTIDGHEFTGSCGLAATKRNESKAWRKEAKARELVLQGRADELKIRVCPFSRAAEEFLAAYTADHNEHPSSAKRAASSLTVLKAYFGRTPVNALTAGKVENFKAWRRTERQEGKKTIAPVEDVTLRNDLRILGQLLRFAKKHGWLCHNPMEDVAIPSGEDAQRITVLTPEEEARYFASCLAEGYQDLHDMGRLMILQGPRPDCEVICARQCDVDLERGLWTIPRSKTSGGERTLKLVHEAREIMARRIREHAGARWLFPSPKLPGRHVAPLNKQHDKVLKNLGYEDGAGWVIYDLRHTFATRMVRRGMPLPQLAGILGHSKRNLRSVMAYVHLCDQDLHAAMEQYGEGAAIAQASPEQQEQPRERVQ